MGMIQTPSGWERAPASFVKAFLTRKRNVYHHAGGEVVVGAIRWYSGRPDDWVVVVKIPARRV